MYKIICHDCGILCTHAFIDRQTCPNCGSLRIPIMVEEELVEVCGLLILRGIEVATACVQSYERLDDDCHIVEVRIDLEWLYPEGSLFSELPPDWELQVFYSQPEVRLVSRLCCSEYLPECESDEESIELAKRVMISNLGSWIGKRDPEASRSVLMLTGYPVANKKIGGTQK